MPAVSVVMLTDEGKRVIEEAEDTHGISGLPSHVLVALYEKPLNVLSVIQKVRKHSAEYKFFTVNAYALAIAELHVRGLVRYK